MMVIEEFNQMTLFLWNEIQFKIIDFNLGQDKLIDDLIKNGTDVNIRDNEGSTPLIYASVNGEFFKIISIS